MNDLNFCIDCTHCNKHNPEGYECLNEELARYNLVTGEKIPVWCVNERKEGGSCGEDGNFFDPK